MLFDHKFHNKYGSYDVNYCNYKKTAFSGKKNDLIQKLVLTQQI